jgi:hypothetical protein
MSAALIPVSWGELLDKLTILDIKRARLAAAGARANVVKEWTLLHEAAQPVLERPQTRQLMDALKTVNETLWEIEDHIREKEKAREFDAEFVELARAVYKNNDQRADLKRQINLALGSELMEEKSYKG